MKRSIFLLLLALIAIPAYAAERACIVPGQGYFRIHVGTAGLFGAFAHDHSIEARKIVGCASIDPKDLQHSSVKLEFPTADIRVIDPKESEKDRAEVQKTMETEVLRVSEYPRVTFESTAVEGAGEANQFRVRGNLTIRGKTQPVVIPLKITRSNDGTYHATGEYRFKQSTFLIKPIQLAGGSIKVKDELQTQFDLYLK
jgi:polyisoprenoid-binding protein YceI